MVVVVGCDATEGAIGVQMPDVRLVKDVGFVFVKTDSTANAVTVTFSNNQSCGGDTSLVLNYQWEVRMVGTELTRYSLFNRETTGYCLSHTASDTAVATGDGAEGFTIPKTWNGRRIVNVVASVYSKGVTGTTDVQVRRVRAGSAADVLSTKITIGDEFFAQDGVIDTDNDDLQTGDQLYVDVDAVHSGTAPNGLSVSIEVV